MGQTGRPWAMFSYVLVVLEANPSSSTPMTWPISRSWAQAGLPDGKIPHCEAHRFTVTLRGLNKTQLSAGLFDERLEETFFYINMILVQGFEGIFLGYELV